MGYIILFFTVKRVPVPDEGACDWGLNRYLRPEDPTCEDCMSYYDGRNSSTNFYMQDCVWVPLEGKCYPKNHAGAQNMDYYEGCEG